MFKVLLWPAKWYGSYTGLCKDPGKDVCLDSWQSFKIFDKVDPREFFIRSSVILSRILKDASKIFEDHWKIFTMKSYWMNWKQQQELDTRGNVLKTLKELRHGQGILKKKDTMLFKYVDPNPYLFSSVETTLIYLQFYFVLSVFYCVSPQLFWGFL